MLNALAFVFKSSLVCLWGVGFCLLWSESAEGVFFSMIYPEQSLKSRSLNILERRRASAAM